MYDQKVLEDLAKAIEGLDIRLGGEDLVPAIALRDQLDARIAEATAAFESGGCWGGDASVSMVAWLRTHARMTLRSAQRLRTLAGRLRSLPACAEAYAHGSLSGGQIEAIVARLDDETAEIFAAQEEDLVPRLIPLNVVQVSRAMGYLVAGRGGRVVDGPHLDGRSVSKLFCDSAVHRVVMSGHSAVLDYGTASRTIPAPLWNAMVIRDEHCRFPDCDRPSVWCEGHHVVACQPGWWRTWWCLEQTKANDGRFEVTDTDGIVRATSPPRTQLVL